MAVIVGPGVQSQPPLPSAESLLQQLQGRLTLADVADSPDQARYAVASVDAANMPILQGVTPVAGMPWPTSAGVTQFNGRTGNVTVFPQDLPPVTTANYQSGWSGANITYTSTPTTATINVASGTLYQGSKSVSYNASSVPVTGSGGTTVTFYLYYVDANYSGGTKTLNASTNAHQVVTNDAYVNIGQIAVTFPTSGTGGGSGGTGCPCTSAWVIRRGWFGLRRKVRAGSIKVGDYLWLAGNRWGRVTFSESRYQPCRKIETVLGTFCCSVSAPLRLHDGEVVVAQDLRVGMWLQTSDGQARICGNLPIGICLVQHITCENDFYWCRSDGLAWFAHHNMKPPG